MLAWVAQPVLAGSSARLHDENRSHLARRVSTAAAAASGSNYFRSNYFRYNDFRFNYFRSDYSRRNYLRSNYFRSNYFRYNDFRFNYFRSNYSRRNYFRLNYLRSNYFRYGCRVAAAEAVQGDGDALAGTRFERGRASRAERASTGTGSSNRPIGSSASLVEAARNPDVDDRSRVIERDRRVAAISVVNCRRVYGKQSQFAVGSRRQGKRQHCSYSIDILNEDQIQTKLCNIINK